MKSVNYFGYGLTVRIFLLLLVSLGLGVVLGQSAWLFSQVVLISLWVILAIEVNRFTNQNNILISRYLNGLHFDDLHSKFQASGKTSSFVQLQMALDRIAAKWRLKKKASQFEYILFTTLLETHSSGLLVYRKSGEVLYQNAKFASLWDIPHISHINQLQKEHAVLHDFATSLNRVFPVVTSWSNAQSQKIHIKIQTKQVMHETLFWVQSDVEVDEAEENTWLQYVLVVNHEIINGITPLIALSDNLSGKVREIKNETLRETFGKGLNIMHSRSKGLLQFSEKYRQITQIPMPNKIDVMWKSLFERLQMAYVENLKSIPFQLSGNALNDWVRADEEQLMRVFSNLLLNSCRALEGVVDPCIGCHVVRTQDEYIVQFKDNGKGISPAQASKLFVPFISSSEGGSGIGLALSRKILANHGGDLTWSSADPEKTTFRIRIPIY